MRLYIANATRQVVDFIYRPTHDGGPAQQNFRKQQISPGGQVRLPEDFSSPEIDSIVGQHAIYGFISVDDVPRSKPFVGICYAIDKEIKLPTIQELFAHNLEVLQERGRKIREDAAVVVHDQIANGLGDGSTGVKSVELSVVEDKPGTTRSGIEEELGTGSPIAEGVRVDKTAEPPARGTRRRK